MSLPQDGNAPPAEATIPRLADDSRLYNFPHLEDDGNNFAVWKLRTEAVLELGDLWGIVNGDISKPDPSAPPNERDEWSCKDREARAQITLTLKDRATGLCP
jgi:hypothetical protein